MKTDEKKIFDKHKVALELGYSEEDIEKFDNLRKVFDYWNTEMEKRRATPKDFPKIDDKLADEYDIYCRKILSLRVKDYAESLRREVV